MKILITGATGFVGSHLSDLLHDEGHEVFSLVRNPKKAKDFNIKGTLIQGSLHPVQKHHWVAELPVNLDAVVHTAGIVHSFSKRDFFSVNTESTRQLMEDLAFKYPKLKFVFISSLAAAGPGANFQKEEDLATPVSDYGRSKLLAEKILQNEAPNTWNKIFIRPPMVIGPRDPAILDVFKMVKNGIVPSVGTKGGQKLYSFIGVFDLIETIKLSLYKETEATEVFYSSFPDAVKFQELLAVIAKVMGKKRKPLILPLPLTAVKMVTKLISFRSPTNVRLTPDKINEIVPKEWTCSGEKASLKLGQSYGWDLEKIVEATLKDYKLREWL